MTSWAGAGSEDFIRRADSYVRLTVFLAAILLLIGVGSHFPVRAARSGLIATACALVVVSLAHLATLP